MTRDNYLLLGSIVKIRGISGEVIIRTKIPVRGIKKNLKSLMIQIDGLLVPFSIVSWRFLTETEIIAAFRDINSKDKAEILKEKDVFILRDGITYSFARKDIHNLSGYKVTDIRIGNIGKTTGIIEVPGNDLLKIKYMEREILLPIQKGLILEINNKKKLIRVDLPDGFLKI
jgi:16S rRNA processing protein RimM